MSTYYQQYLGRFVIGTSNDSFSVGGTALALTNGNYYLAGYSGESTSQLCEHMQAVIRSGTAYSGATVTYSGTTGLVTIDIGSTATVEFTDGYLSLILGFSSATQSGASSYTSDQTPRYIWRPTYSASNHPVELLNFWQAETTTRVHRSKSGKIYSIVGHELNTAVIEYGVLPKADVITPSDGTIYRDFQQFFSDVVHAGQPMRVYPDRTVNTSADYFVAMFTGGDSDVIGDFSRYASRTQDDYNGLWSVTMPLVEYVQ